MPILRDLNLETTAKNEYLMMQCLFIKPKGTYLMLVPDFILVFGALNEGLQFIITWLTSGLLSSPEGTKHPLKCISETEKHLQFLIPNESGTPQDVN